MTDAVCQPDVALERLAARAGRLYSLPAVAVRLLELARDPDPDLGAVARLLETDPALTAKVLRVVNSSLFGLAHRVGDVRRALALLGVPTLKLLVLGFSLPPQLADQIETEALAHYWRRTLTKAAACRAIARQAWDADGDEPFVAGLLQDIGLLVLIQQLGDPFLRMLRCIRAEQADLAAQEREVFGFRHVELTARLLEHWGLPPRLTAAVGDDRAPEDTAALPPDEQQTVQSLQLGELAAQALADGRAEAVGALQRLAARYCGWSDAQVRELLESLASHVEQLAEAFDVQLADPPDYGLVLAEAHAELARASEEAAAALAVSGASQAPGGGNARRPERAEGGRNEAAARGPAERVADDPGLLGRVAEAITACRRARRPLTLLLLELDDYDALLLTLGPDEASQLPRLLRSVLDAVSDSDRGCVALGDACFGLLLPGYDRSQALDSARRLAASLRRWLCTAPETRGRDLTFSIGVATLSLPPKNFPAGEMTEAAERCLHAARFCGGDAIKSIML